MTTKHCRDCNTTKPTSSFGVRRDRPCGLTPYCRACLSLRWRRWAGVESRPVERKAE